MLITSLSVPGIHLQCAPKVRMIIIVNMLSAFWSGSNEYTIAGCALKLVLCDHQLFEMLLST